MKILAFETSAKAASAALTENGKLLAESYQNTGMTHSQTLMVMAQDLLKQLNLTAKDMDALIFSIIPNPGRPVNPVLSRRLPQSPLPWSSDNRGKQASPPPLHWKESRIPPKWRISDSFP